MAEWNSKPIIYNGKEYRSRKELCDKYGLYASDVAKYAKDNNYDFVSAFEIKLELKKNRDVKLEFNGVEYTSKRSLCQEYGVGHQRVRDYANKNNVSFLEAFEWALRTKKVKYPKEKLELNGVAYSSKKELCEANGVNLSSVSKVVRETDMDYMEAFKMLYGREKISITYDGVEYTTKKELCEAYEVSVTAVYGYQNNHKVSFMEAFEAVKAREKLVFDNQTWSCITNLCKNYSVDIMFVRKVAEELKCKLIVAFEAAYELTKPIEFDGIKYKSVERLIFSYKMPKVDVCRAYIECDCDINRAIELSIKRHCKPIITFRGKDYYRYTHLCADYEVPISTFNGLRQREKCSDLEAIEKAIEIKRDASLVYGGVHYQNLEEFCAKYGLSASTIRLRSRRDQCDYVEAINRAYSPEEITRRLWCKKYSIEEINDNLYKITCPDCGRHLFLEKDEIFEFKHSDEFCSSRVWE